jgi:hypothetical protein
MGGGGRARCREGHHWTAEDQERESGGFGPAPPLDLVGAASSLGYGRVGEEEGSSFGRACA